MTEKPVDENYGEVVMGRNQMGTPISLPEEFRDGGVLDFGREHAFGWTWEGRFFLFGEGEVSIERFNERLQEVAGGSPWSFSAVEAEDDD
jgi:hypothetical protein